MYQTQRAGKYHEYWYARPAIESTVGVKTLAERISDRCTVTEPDILAVISALVKELRYELKSGRRVKLDGLGAFKPSFRCKGVKERKDFSVVKNITETHIIFQPERRKMGSRTMVKLLLDGVTFQEIAPEQEEKKGGEKKKPEEQHTP